MAQDLNELDTKAPAERGTVVELDHPDATKKWLDDDGNRWTIKILGADAGKVRGRAQKQLDSYIALIRKGKDPGFSADNEKDNTDRLAAATIAWHLPPLDGVAFPDPPTEEAAKKFYSDPRFPWIVEQLTKAINDRSRFFTTNSSS